MRIGFNDHYYELIYDESGITWSDAHDAANARPLPPSAPAGWFAHLVTITSSDETVFINDYCNTESGDRNIFIGGYQDITALDYSEPAGGWRWVTGEELDYTNWRSLEPNNSNGNEHKLQLCLPIYGRLWNDTTDTVLFNWYLVEYDEFEAIPEPATIMLFGLGGLALLRKRRGL